ncbi:MAG: hypothetical protein WDM77_21970 [Steroidobacteraceae bacterium]
MAGSISAAPALGFSLGGSGSAGASANTVTVYTSGSVSTAGDDSHGIVVQSVGGGGGTGGFSVAGSASGSSASAAASIGGPGGAGGDGAAVWLTSSGAQVATAGAHAYGILVQSVGRRRRRRRLQCRRLPHRHRRGGGLESGRRGPHGRHRLLRDGQQQHQASPPGGRARSGYSPRAWAGAAATAASVSQAPSAQARPRMSPSAARGSGGGAAGMVTVGTTLIPDVGTIITAGDGAVGLLAQSIGGGGGQWRIQRRRFHHAIPFRASGHRRCRRHGQRCGRGHRVHRPTRS